MCWKVVENVLYVPEEVKGMRHVLGSGSDALCALSTGGCALCAEAIEDVCHVLKVLEVMCCVLL